jgi:hypothetical protein
MLCNLDAVDPPSPKVKRASTKAAAAAKALPFMVELSYDLSDEKSEEKENGTGVHV